MTLEETTSLVLAAIESRIGSRRDLQPETPLFESGLGLDSIEFLELLLDVEKACGHRLRDETLTEAAVANVGSLIDYIHALGQS